MLVSLDPMPTTIRSRIARSLDREQQNRQAVKVALLSSGWGVAAVQCEVFDETAVLSGTVATYYHKQIAQEVVLRLAAIRRVVNSVEVRPG